MTPLAWIKVGVGAAAVLALALFGWWVQSVKAERDQLRTALDTATAANDSQTKALAALKERADRDAVQVAELTETVTKIRRTADATRRRLRSLEAADADVRAYFDRPVPAGLRGLLSDEGGDEDGHGAVAPASAAAPALRPPGPDDLPADGGHRGVAPGVEKVGPGVRGVEGADHPVVR